MKIKQITAATGAAMAVWAALPPALLAAEEGEPGLFSINLGLSIWTIVVFLVLVVLLKKFAWGPILSSVEAREEGIQGALDEAARLRAEASELLEEHRRQLADSRRQANQIIAESREHGDQLKREMEEKAREEGQRIVARARVEIEREKEKTILAIRREAVDIALDAASRLIQERMDAKADREFVTRYLDEVRSPGEVERDLEATKARA
jgi:F-type H+-transporting ATPase subunit b